MYDITTRIDLTQLVPLNGEGKNSTVYTFIDPQLGKEFIVKKIEKQLIYDDYNDTSDTNLFNESRILYKVKHPNIMEIQYASQDDDYVYMVMPRCNKGSLESIINNEYLTVRKILKYSLEFLLGLHYVHANGLIHFDIKPTNILVNDNNKAILTDFGLSKFINLYGLSRPNKFYTPHYPPEAILSNLISNKSDIYQAGITMYRFCNGNDMFKNQLNNIDIKNLANEILKGNFPDRKKYLPHIPSKLRRIINKCLEINPDDRYETVLDIINDLSRIDSNLDLIYEKISHNKCVIKSLNEKMTHYNCIEIIKNGDKYNTSGYKVKIQDNTSIKISKLTLQNLNRTNVYKTIENNLN